MFRLRRFARIAAGVVALLGVSLLWLHANYPLPYVYRVLAYRDADFADIHWFPAHRIGASSRPFHWQFERKAELARAIESRVGADSLASFLQDSQTSAFLVVHDGKLIEEMYFDGYDETSMQNTLSVSKSILSALIGIAAGEGLLDVDDELTLYLPELAARDVRFTQIRLRNLLDMRSGIPYDPGIRFPIVNRDDALTYYHPDLREILLERTTIDAPPGGFHYNNYNPGLLGLALTRVAGMSVSRYLETRLWDPLGAHAAAGWSTDDTGFERMESGFFATARDLARFGQLYLEDGLLGNRRVLPQSWVRESTVPDEPIELETYDGRGWGYQHGWWLVPRPAGRPDFTAIGRFGQFVYVSPQYGTVFVRTGPGRGDLSDFDWTELFYATAASL